MSCARILTQDSQDPRVPDIFATMEESCSGTVDPVLDVGWSSAPSLPSHLAPPDHVMLFLSFLPGSFEGRKMLAPVAYANTQNNARNMHCHYPQHCGPQRLAQQWPDIARNALVSHVWGPVCSLPVAHHVSWAGMIFSSGQDGGRSIWLSDMPGSAWPAGQTHC